MAKYNKRKPKNEYNNFTDFPGDMENFDTLNTKFKLISIANKYGKDILNEFSQIINSIDEDTSIDSCGFCDFIREFFDKYEKTIPNTALFSIIIDYVNHAFGNYLYVKNETETFIQDYYLGQDIIEISDFLNTIKK